MTTIIGLLETTANLRERRPWEGEQTLVSIPPILAEETKEIKKTIMKMDLENFNEEIGSALWDSMFLMRVAENSSIFLLDAGVGDFQNKMVHRLASPFADPRQMSALEVGEQCLTIRRKE